MCIRDRDCPQWAANAARRIELRSKKYWKKLFKYFAPDLHAHALESELYWEEGSLPGPPEHYLHGVWEAEHT
eukprot:11663608-Alexandrium_andersonii.AAC.1